ncbi:MAG: DUF6090 family protein [Saprospiraceae bacterium]|nr:DUF6090 family protein [Saprospiraceae bacterium]
MKKTISKLVFEMIPVILGILIALFINNWKEVAANQRFVNRVLRSIEQEVQQNIGSLDTVLRKQENLLDTLQHYMEDETVTLSSIIIRAGGLKVPRIQNVSWKSFLNTKIELIDFETISLLSSIDEMKKMMDLKVEKTIDVAIQFSESTAVRHKKVLMYQVLNMADSEQGLLKIHQDYLDHINKEKQ